MVFANVADRTFHRGRISHPDSEVNPLAAKAGICAVMNCMDVGYPLRSNAGMGHGPLHRHKDDRINY